jgi:hypothetical protein
MLTARKSQWRPHDGLCWHVHEVHVGGIHNDIFILWAMHKRCMTSSCLSTSNWLVPSSPSKSVTSIAVLCINYMKLSISIIPPKSLQKSRMGNFWSGTIKKSSRCRNFLHWCHHGIFRRREVALEGQFEGWHQVEPRVIRVVAYRGWVGGIHQQT